ncbi:MAG: murein L,D-transpeptidase catalytic domain family protein [Hyphomonas sp.]|nr:murein L,D-transpeptidase catalytic domain family protein [Hyphomonas sp.]
MMSRVALFMLGFLMFVAPAHAKTLDPDARVRPELLARALEAIEARSPERRDPGKLVVVDYSLHSSQERLFVIDLETGAVTAFRAAHGLGSDADHDGFLDSFSGVPESQASPEGTFRVAEEYTGKHGQSYRLDGLDAANKTARARAIVIHAADYAEPDFLKQHGKLGRSNGCIVFSKADLARFTEAVSKGTLIFVGK